MDRVSTSGCTLFRLIRQHIVVCDYDLGRVGHRFERTPSSLLTGVL